MEKYLFVIFIIGMTLLTNGKLFSQSAPTENDTEIVDTKKSKLFNEGGYVRGITPARVIGLVEVLLGLMSILFATRAKKRASITGAKTALTLGLLAVIFSIVHFITTAGAVFGSGSGKAGAIVAFVLSMIGMTLSRSVLYKKRM